MAKAKAKPPNLDASWVGSIIKWMSSANTWLYEKTGGKMGGKFAGAPVMLLTTTGRTSGEPRTKPLLYLRDGDNVICVASQGGRKTDPLWYKNLVANPECTVKIGTDASQRRARTATPEEKERLWPKLVEMYKSFADYQTWTDRTIPVVILERV